MSVKTRLPLVELDCPHPRLAHGRGGVWQRDSGRHPGAKFLPDQTTL